MSALPGEPTDALEDALVAYDVECEGNLFGTSGAGAYQLALHLHAAGFRMPDQVDEQQRDDRLLLVWSEGFVAGATTISRELGGDVMGAFGYERALHALGHVGEDPIARTQIVDRLVHLWNTGTQAPPTVVDVHGRAHPEAGPE